MTDVAARLAAKRGAIVRNQAFWGVVAIVLLLAINVSSDPGYLSIGYNDGRLSGNLIDILRAAAPILMIAVGMCLVVATGGIDLSVGSIMVVAGAVTMELLSSMNTPDSLGNAALTIAIALGIATALGAVNGILVSVVGLQPFISTLVMMLAGRGIAKVITGGQNTTADNEQVEWLANGYIFGLPVVFLLSVVIVVLVLMLVRRSALGLMLEAIGMDSRASRLAGVKRRNLQLTVYSVSGLLAGIAGVFATASVMTVDVSRTGYQLELDAILAVVIGGTSLAGGKFSIGGAVIGGLLIATLDKTVVFLGIPASATPAFKAIVIVALCLLQSERVRSLFRQRRALRAQSQKEAVPA
jgi:galactofuranose transport system permease protein